MQTARAIATRERSDIEDTINQAANIMLHGTRQRTTV